jgi:hypothetical protein
MRFVILAACLAALAYLAYRVTVRYRAATGTRFQRALEAAQGSATVLWAYVVAAGGLLLQVASQAADVLNMPEIREWITGYLSAEIAGGALTAIGIVTVLARLRTLLEPADEAPDA